MRRKRSKLSPPLLGRRTSAGRISSRYGFAQSRNQSRYSRKKSGLRTPPFMVHYGRHDKQKDRQTGRQLKARGIYSRLRLLPVINVLLTAALGNTELNALPHSCGSSVLHSLFCYSSAYNAVLITILAQGCSGFVEFSEFFF